MEQWQPWKSTTPTPSPTSYGTPISPLTMVVNFDTDDQIHIKIYDPNQERWEVPQSLLPTPETFTTSTSTSSIHQPRDSLNYEFPYTSNPLGFAVTRLLDDVVIFNTTTLGLFNGLVFEDQYLEISTQLPPKANIYGLGEHSTRLRLNSMGQTYTFWVIVESFESINHHSPNHHSSSSPLHT